MEYFFINRFAIVIENPVKLAVVINASSIFDCIRVTIAKMEFAVLNKLLCPFLW